jgi:RimJ/RimL family protein N-acetyltransferase
MRPAACTKTSDSDHQPADGERVLAWARAQPRQVLDWRAGLPVLRLPAVRLREPALDDAASLFDHLATDQVARFMSRPPTRAAGFERFIRWLHDERRKGRCLCYGIVPEGQDHAVGLIQVRQLEPGFGSAEWGFALGQRFWGTGIFVPCAEVTVDFVFRHVGAYRLEARASTLNGRANGALRKVGAAVEGVLRQSLIGTPEPMDQALWSLHAEDWLARIPPPYAIEPAVPPDEPATLSVAAPPEPASWRNGLPTLRTIDCVLRDLRPGDARSLVRHLSDPDVERYIPPSPSTQESFEQFIVWALRQRDAGRYACFAIVPSGTEEAVGIFQVRQLDPSFKTAEWGFAMGKAYWGSGIFLSGAIAVLDFAFDGLGVHRLEARAPTGNARGNGALRKVGARLEGQLKRSFLLGGVYHDDALWALLAVEWHRVRPTLTPGGSLF